MSKNKGITLIALVITIVILIILVGISINLAFNENGIITQAKKASEETKRASKNELKNLTQLESSVNLENKEYKDSNGDIAIVPARFAVSQIEGENLISNGLVIIDEKGNEFVWVPVENAITTDTNEANKNKSMALLNKSTENYSGIMYNFEVGSNNSISSTVRTTNYFEPKLATWSDTDERLSKYGYSSSTQFLETMQTEYNKMVESVNKYKGFYIGRYETSIDENGNVQSKKGMLPWSGASINWYNLYEKQKTFNSNSVQSSMIWGSQYDAMLNWVISDNNYKLLEITRDETEKVTCGSNKKDVINQIYDLTGNTFEWTLAEGAQLNSRMHRGGYFGLQSNALRTGYTVSGYFGNMNGSRMTLYIK